MLVTLLKSTSVLRLLKIKSKYITELKMQQNRDQKENNIENVAENLSLSTFLLLRAMKNIPFQNMAFSE